MDLMEHMWNVRSISKSIAKSIHLDAKAIKEIETAAYLHDVGKFIIPNYILYKDHKLNEQEFSIMKQHSIIGANVLSEKKFSDGVIKAVKHHHERYDGLGYPDGLKGNEIPFNARIIAVADAFDAMVSNRCYKSNISVEMAIKEILINSGTQFDPYIAQIFSNILKNKKSSLT
ncbi:HD domain-containing protein [Clostridium sp. 19966]|uniref:HD-GYP domain-containing protein n=1 Tax=Clostridium sp. 19966 TaxID=2768166 RepID=UPI0028E05CE9|nr:HD domain-containing phosphohydrolase [Clostridium sp. 19966]MDT8718239.1 HD domain-containing protein [Clostridium sp. 19966]